MAKSKHNSLQYAIKFYLSQAAFQAEVALYGSSGSTRSSIIAKFLPLVRLFRQLNLQCIQVGDTVGPPIVLEKRNRSAPKCIQGQQPQKHMYTEARRDASLLQRAWSCGAAWMIGMILPHAHKLACYAICCNLRPLRTQSEPVHAGC